MFRFLGEIITDCAGQFEGMTERFEGTRLEGFEEKKSEMKHQASAVDNNYGAGFQNKAVDTSQVSCLGLASHHSSDAVGATGALALVMPAAVFVGAAAAALVTVATIVASVAAETAAAFDGAAIASIGVVVPAGVALVVAAAAVH